MSTVICNKEMMVADSLTTFGQANATANKMWVVGDSVFGAVGWVSDCAVAREWTIDAFSTVILPNAKKVAKPSIGADNGFRMLELTKDGYVGCYDHRLVNLKLKCDRGIYAIGSGASYALGAAYAGTRLMHAVSIACQLDIGNSGEPIRSMKWLDEEQVWLKC